MLQYGTLKLDGNLSDWSQLDALQITPAGNPMPGQPPPGTQLYGTSVGDAFVFGLAIGSSDTFANTHLLLNTDLNAPTGTTFYGSVDESLQKLPNLQYVLASGIDYEVSIAADGTPQLLTGSGTLVATLPFAVSGNVVEFAVPQSLLANAPTSASVQLKSYNGGYGVSYVPPTVLVAPPAAPTYGTITINSLQSGWTAADRLDTPATGVAGYELYGKAASDAFVIAIKAPIVIGANTTIWLDADNNAATGYQIWGFAGGAEYNVNFDAKGTPSLFTGAAGQALVSADLPHAYSADGKFVEIAIPKSLIGSPAEISTLFDVNDQTFVPTLYVSTQYTIGGAGGTNTSPTIVSNGGGDTAAVSVVENTTAVTSVTATDPDVGQTLTYAILLADSTNGAGADGSLFTINASTGALSFKSAPNYELPTDASGINVYDMTVLTYDGHGGVAKQSLAVTVANVDEPAVGGYDVGVAATGSGHVRTVTVTNSNITDGDLVSAGNPNGNAGPISYQWQYSADGGTTWMTFKGPTAASTITLPGSHFGQPVHAVASYADPFGMHTVTSMTTIVGDASVRVLTGTTGNDQLIGVGGNHLFEGGPGNDIMTGGGGNTFVFKPGFGNDTITDFHAADRSGTPHDVIRISNSLFTGWKQLQTDITDTAHGAVIQVDTNDTITLNGVTKAQLLANHFVDFHFV